MLRFLLKGVFRDRHRYLFPLLIVSSGVLIMVFMLALINGYMGSFIRANAGFDTGHLKVVTLAYSEVLAQKPYDLGFLDIQKDFAKWKARYPQLNWVQRIHFGALLGVPSQADSLIQQGEVLGFGIDLLSSTRERQLMNLDKALRKGRMPHSDREILISDNALNRLNLKLGDSVLLFGSDIDGALSSAQFSVCGTLGFGTEALDRGAVIADLAAVRKLLNMEGGASEILGFFQTGEYDREEAALIKADFNRSFSDPDNEFSPLMLSMEDQNNMGYIMAMLDRMMAIFSFVFIIILGIVLWNSGLMNGIRRYGEFGVRLAMGESKLHIYETLLLEAAGVGVIGSALGIMLGLVLSAYFNLYGMDASVFSRNSSLLSEDIIYTSIEFSTALAGFVPGILSTLLGAALAGLAVFRRQTAQLFKELET
ncbi:MAG TPA: FtsX-like permease family protein [Candidatus Cloacimonas sp.]|nr:FtsX-like permease family protein [Candidatus Cloacimonas sp.]